MDISQHEIYSVLLDMDATVTAIESDVRAERDSKRADLQAVRGNRGPELRDAVDVLRAALLENRPVKPAGGVAAPEKVRVGN